MLDQLAAAATGSVVTRKAVTPTDAETAANPRSRSAKLRVFQKAGGEGLKDSSNGGGGSRERAGSKRRARGQQRQLQDAASESGSGARDDL